VENVFQIQWCLDGRGKGEVEQKGIPLVDLSDYFLEGFGIHAFWNGSNGQGAGGGLSVLGLKVADTFDFKLKTKALGVFQWADHRFLLFKVDQKKKRLLRSGQSRHFCFKGGEVQCLSGIEEWVILPL